MDDEAEIFNQSPNRPFQHVLKTYISRRDILKGSLATAAMTLFTSRSSANKHHSLINFKPVAITDGSGPWPCISSDYQWSVLLPWGTALQPDGPAFSYPPSANDQAKQIGIGHDGMHFFPIKDIKKSRYGWDDFSDWHDDKDWHTNLHRYRHCLGNQHGLLCINHEFGINQHVLGKNRPSNKEDTLTSQHAHGVSVVEIKEEFGKWASVKSNYSRRIHVNTPVEFSGPVADSQLLKTVAMNASLGTVNNCAGGYTPWGTYLSCEENFNNCFAAKSSWTPTEEQQRYGFTSSGVGYGWEKFDDRFDLSNAKYKNEENRFGWIVEIDPMNKHQTPVKRTALGRFKHEGIALTIGQDGRVVGYMGDDQQNDYIYKFVSENNWHYMLQQDISPLDEGRLYVARFNDDGTGDWLELSIKNTLLSARFNDQAEILTYTRIAADLMGATPMDRPEWTSVAADGYVYCSLTNNHLRVTSNAANPSAPNPDGHIIRFKDTDNHTGKQFKWNIFLLAKDTHGSENTFSDPDGLMADPDGRLFIQTDGRQENNLNNQLLVADINTGELKRLFTGVTDDEITGITMTPDRRTMFINTQHPGRGDPSKTNFPAPFDGVTVPRDSTIVITRKDGGIIGS
ncbi:MAG: PhoX family phosphatase [Gammaproteobacteria bacterium]